MNSVGKTERSTLTTCNPALHARDPVIGWRQGGGPLRTIETAEFEIAIGPRSELAMAQLGCEGALASPWTPVVHCSGQHDPCRFRASLSYPNPMQIVLQERLLEENNSPAPRDLADLVAKKHKTDSNRLKSTRALNKHHQ